MTGPRRGETRRGRPAGKVVGLFARASRFIGWVLLPERLDPAPAAPVEQGARAAHPGQPASGGPLPSFLRGLLAREPLAIDPRQGPTPRARWLSGLVAREKLERVELPGLRAAGGGDLWRFLAGREVLPRDEPPAPRAASVGLWRFLARRERLPREEPSGAARDRHERFLRHLFAREELGRDRAGGGEKSDGSESGAD